MQISKSTLVNLSYLDSIEAGFNGTLLLKLKNGCKDYVSRKYLPEFKKYLWSVGGIKIEKYNFFNHEICVCAHLTQTRMLKSVRRNEGKHESDCKKKQRNMLESAQGLHLEFSVLSE